MLNFLYKNAKKSRVIKGEVGGRHGKLFKQF